MVVDDTQVPRVLLSQGLHTHAPGTSISQTRVGFLLCFRLEIWVSRGNRDIGVAFQSHLVGHASSRVEAKDSTILSSRDV